MNPEIQLHNTAIKGDIVEVDYSLVDDAGIANIQQQITVKSLIGYILDNGCNHIYDDGGVVYLDARIFLSDNIRKVVLWYLEGSLVA